MNKEENNTLERSNDRETKVLEKEVMKKKSLSLEVFPMVLYRLGREPDPATRLTILYTLPSLAVNKLCVALVLKTLLALWGSGSLRPLVLRLVHDLWTVEPRTYSYLSQLINDRSINSPEVQIARAFVVTSICKSKPSQHGEELLPLLSKVLNECRGNEGTAQALIALDGWIKLMKGCPEAHIPYVQNFIKSLVAREVAGLPKGIYMTAVQEAKRRGVKGSGGQPEPPSYSFLKDTSTLRTLHIERLTSPSLWWEVTNERLYRAAVLRCHVAEKDPEEMALPWLNDLVDSAASLPGDRSHLLSVMSNTLVTRCLVNESTSWFLQLLGRLRDHLKRKTDDNLVAMHEQQQRITFYLDLLVMGLIVWSGLWATNHMQVLAETPALRDRLLLPSLVTLSGQPAWVQTLSQFLNWMVSCHTLLQNYNASRYHLGSPTLLLATLNPSISQVMWNKVIAMLV
ncbi:putative focadhesin [Penaeus vannamei]|uniref:Putative focadhesin n=1 Tax=Penaeus vannamei TaxID=6689 RepID=A0A3R7M0U0_PENVA|nr:putative focadhesin [Penaeus vannamei]